MKNTKNKKIDGLELVLYKAPNGAIELRGDFSHETVWATQADIANIFGVTSQNVNMHIRNVYKQKELNELATCKKSLQVQIEGTRKIKRQIKEYNLDTIIAVGYRINSIQGTRFRQWATKTLREYLVKGYVLNKKQIRKNHKEFLKNVQSIQALLPVDIALDNKALLELVKEFSSTWQSLDAYDRNKLKPIGETKKAVEVSSGEFLAVLQSLRSELIKKKEATAIFAQERSRGSIEGILGSVMQTFDSKPVYATYEEKAANLLYFMVKNHPFVDGNKRSGAFAFLWFLRKTKIKGYININPGALTALTLLIAESNPKKKEQMVALTTALLSTKK